MSGSIRFLKTTSNYENYISRFVARHPGVKDLSYNEALSTYLADANGWSDFWKINLEALGNFNCCEIIQNAGFLQKKWADENGIRFTESWQSEILLAQIEQFKPDIVFLVDQYSDNSLAGSLKKKFPFIKLILGWDGILWHQPETYRHTDIILSCVPETVEFYKQHGKKAWYHKFGFETSMLSRLTKKNQQHEVVFSGSLILSQN